MNLLLIIWGVISVIVILLLLIFIAKTDQKHALSIILIDNSVAREPDLMTTIISELTDSDNNLIHLYRTTSKYTPTKPLPNNIVELNNDGTLYTYAIIGTRYKIKSFIKGDKVNTFTDIIDLNDLISGIQFKIIALLSINPESGVVVTPNSIIIPFVSGTSINEVNENLMIDKEITTSITSTKIFFIKKIKINN